MITTTRLDTFKGSEVPKMHPRLIPHHCLISVGNGAVFGRDKEPIIGAGNDLGLAPNHFLELECRFRLLVVLIHSEFSDLLHLGVFRVLNRLPTADSTTAQCCGGNIEEKREREKDHDEEEKRLRIDTHFGMH